jgi:hypothetical protein
MIEWDREQRRVGELRGKESSKTETLQIRELVICQHY